MLKRDKEIFLLNMKCYEKCYWYYTRNLYLKSLCKSSGISKKAFAQFMASCVIYMVLDFIPRKNISQKILVLILKDISFYGSLGNFL